MVEVLKESVSEKEEEAKGERNDSTCKPADRVSVCVLFPSPDDLNQRRLLPLLSFYLYPSRPAAAADSFLITLRVGEDFSIISPSDCLIRRSIKESK